HDLHGQAGGLDDARDVVAEVVVAAALEPADLHADVELVGTQPGDLLGLGGLAGAGHDADGREVQGRGDLDPGALELGDDDGQPGSGHHRGVEAVGDGLTGVGDHLVARRVRVDLRVLDVRRQLGRGEVETGGVGGGGTGHGVLPRGWWAAGIRRSGRRVLRGGRRRVTGAGAGGPAPGDLRGRQSLDAYSSGTTMSLPPNQRGASTPQYRPMLPHGSTAPVRTTALAWRARPPSTSACGRVVNSAPVKPSWSHASRRGLWVGTSSARTTPSTTSSSAIRSRTVRRSGRFSARARSMRWASRGTGKPASTTSSRSVWPRVARTPLSSALRMPERFMVVLPFSSGPRGGPRGAPGPGTGQARQGRAGA